VKPKRKKKIRKAKSKSYTYGVNLTINQALNRIADQRTGGSLNVKGIGFQLIYACGKILQELNPQNTGKEIQLEGMEDLDILRIDHNEFIQVKSSSNQIDAGVFWKMGVLQNYFEVYQQNREANFRFVCNASISKGKLSDLSNSNYTDDVVNHWKGKIEKEGNDLSEIDFSDFLSKVRFEKTNEKNLLNTCKEILIEKYEVNSGSEQQFLIALFYHVFEWSKHRKVISYIDLKQVIQSVHDSFSKTPTNQAIKYNWITQVSYDTSNSQKEDGYFDGKAAKPIHIAMRLPVRRKKWEDIISKSIEEFDVTIIKSSSGQGKSTLAWQIAKNQQDSGFSIYQLNYCKSEENSEGIFDFIKSRLKIGQIPLIVIDGLNELVRECGILINRIVELPVKVIVTSRQEDWYRYGFDESKTLLNIVDIKLSIDEAKEVFNQLKSRGRIHSEIKNWEPIWEKIESKELLIEYVYLLTQGGMIEERLQEQVKILNKEISAPAKIEILRLISLTDILNIKIQTKVLTEYIQSEIGFQSDRGEIYKQLEKEYYVRFDLKYAEGLHPVRSQHLVDIVHQTLSIEDSLLTILKIIDEEFIYDYFISIPFLVNKESKSDFYNESAKILSKRKFSEMVYAVDGLMHNEPDKYLSQNKVIFDTVFVNGGIELFIANTLPFTKQNTIKDLKESMGEKFPNLHFLYEKLNELSIYDIDKSDLMMFAKKLSQLLNNYNEPILEYEGVGSLVKWFKQLNIPLPDIPGINEKLLIKIIQKKAVLELSELFSYFYIRNTKTYKSFLRKHKLEIIAVLKRETNSLTIEEIGNDISINYLLDDNADKANDCSVQRIQTVYSFLPIYDNYCTEAIVLPFPDEGICKVVVQESIKAMPKENIPNTFDVHINKIWIKTIMHNYSANSIFEWQEEHLELRKKGVEFAKMCNRYFETLLENKSSRLKSTGNSLIEFVNILSKLMKTRKTCPQSSKRYYEEEVFKDEQKAISEWCFPLDNFLNQFAGIIQPKEDNDRNLAIFNMKAIVYRLSKMQSAYKEIQEATFEYFPTQHISENEQVWYERLLRTVSFFIYRATNQKTGNIIVAKNAIDNWWKKHHEKKLTQIYSIIKQYEKDSHFKFYLPNKIIEDESSMYLVIGVERIDMNNFEQDFLDLMGGLVELSSTDIDFFSFINIQDNQAISGFRVQKEFIDRIRVLLEEGQFEESEYGNPLPLILDKNLLEPLEGITIKPLTIEKGNEYFTEMMYSVWKLSECRKRLNIENEIEKQWLEEIEQDYIASINECLTHIKHDNTLNEFQTYELLINQIIDREKKISVDEIVSHLNNRINEIYS